ncbi:uncharacterized protein LOC123539169 [Mercenaria mercenaria]|uniref:uncharacterized protein LOC123539169 n=1 Tax=Mercenaria mercenaria TaxID=6596 RepID=UPI00234E84C8|nr:uncharacterized protein LOC123539169 [Mercenaria mercenaria]
MVSVGFCIFDSIAVIETAVRLSYIYALVLDNTHVNTTLDPIIAEEEPSVGQSKGDVYQTVKQYARFGLCRDFDGQKYFYNAMKTKFCSLPLLFTANHVIGLCRKRDFMLDKWVSELFDFDGDGYISHLERTYYN